MENGHFSSETALATYGQCLGKIGLLFISTFHGHTVYEAQEKKSCRKQKANIEREVK